VCEVERHLATCRECAADVARLERLMARVHAAPAPTAPVDELWSDLRARIDETKLAPLATKSVNAPSPAWRPAGVARRVATVAVIVVAIAGITSVAGLVIAPRINRSAVNGASPVAQVQTTATPANAPALTAAADSERLYEEEAQLLLNRLELERSMLRPETARAVDRDLRVIDQAIAELKDAVARDPRNAALHQLLASSYRQKAELLKRLANAG
jgi:hypothetical protein